MSDGATAEILDHTPGALLLTETGGHVARLDGRPYHPAGGKSGLLVARKRIYWGQVRSTLFD